MKTPKSKQVAAEPRVLEPSTSGLVLRTLVPNMVHIPSVPVAVVNVVNECTGGCVRMSYIRFVNVRDPVPIVPSVVLSRGALLGDV